MDGAVKFEGGRCFVFYANAKNPAYSYDAPLEAFGNKALVDDLTSREFIELLNVARHVLDLPVAIGVPVRDLRHMVAFELQALWYAEIPGGITKNSAQNLAAAREHYQRVVADIKEGKTMANVETIKNVETGATSTQAKGKAPRVPKGPAVKKVFEYRLNTTLPERITKGVANAQTSNHDFIICQVMQANPTAKTVATITPLVAATGRYVTKDELSKSVRWHLNKMEDEGVVIATDVTPAVAPQPSTHAVQTGASTQQAKQPGPPSAPKAKRFVASKVNADATPAPAVTD